MPKKEEVVEKQIDWVQDPQNELAKLEQGITIEQIQLSEKIGALKATAFVKKLVTVTEIKLLAEVKETKSYKGLKVIGEDGKLVTVTTFEQFCLHLGISREKADQDILNLSAFGEDFLETSQRMGLGYRDLRKLRKLPETDREILVNGEAVKTEDRESLLDLIEEMSAKQSKDKAALEKQVADLKADTEAKDALLAKKDEKLNELDTELTKFSQLTTDARLLARQVQERTALDTLYESSRDILLVIQQFHCAVNDLNQFAASDIHIDDQINQTVHYVYQQIAQVSLEQGIQVSFEDVVNPPWAKPLAQDD